MDLGAIKAGLAPAYDVLEEVGAGAMATVYRAVDSKHQRSVAIKVLRPEHAAVHGADRFLQEIGLTARLSHPHILPLLDSGAASGLPFYVMPLVDGESLRSRLDREPRLPLAEALRIASQVADALAYAHAQGVLHRDIKPDNVLVSGKHALVADFGIAKAVQAAAVGNTYQTHVGQVVGTPAYMSPEQAAGDEVDGRSDVYSLAAMLFEMVVGEAVWGGGTLQAVISKRFVEPPPSARLRRPDVPPTLDDLLRHALAREPNERIASAAEFADALIAVQLSLTTMGSQTALRPNPVQPVASVAVLPFENLSTDAENAFLSDGITEDILTSLARLPTVRVCARSSCFALKGQAVDARSAGERLGVRNIVTGSVRRAGNRLRVSAELVDVVDGFPRWTERYDRTVEDIFAIQDEISAAIVDALNVKLGAHHTGPGAQSTGVIQAYESVLRGRELLNRRTEETTQEAIGAFQHAVKLDPRFATAYAGLADSWAMLAIYGLRAPNEAMPEAERRAEDALKLAPQLAEPRATLALVQGAYHWDWSAADRTFQSAFAASPSYATAHQWYATTVLVPHRRFDDALEATTRAMRLDPLSLACKATLSAVLFYAQRYHEAIDAANHALSVDSAFAPAYFFLAQALTQLNDYDAAQSAAERACERSGRSSESLAVIGYVYGRRGDVAAAEQVLAELQQRAESRYVAASHMALVNLGLERVGPALDDLTRAVQARASDLIWLGVRPAWQPLYGYQRFRDILGRIGVTAVS